MNIRDKKELVSAIWIGAFGIYVVLEASSLAYFSEFGPGPGFLPLWLGIGLVVLALSLILVNFSRSSHETSNDSQSWVGARRALAGWLGLMVAIFLFPLIGFALSFVFLTMFLIVALDRRPPLIALGVAVGLAVGFHLIFVVALGVTLPATPWGF